MEAAWEISAAVSLGFFTGFLLVLVCFILACLKRRKPRHSPSSFAFVPVSLPHALAEHWMQVPLFAQPLDDQGNPFCANLECGLPLENPYHFIEMAAPGGGTITRVFCADCQARLMEERRAIFCGQ